MKIEFTRSGGAAGIRLTLSLDTTDLSSEEASHLSRLVETAGLFDMQPAQLQAPAAPDRFVYHLEIESQVWGNHSVVLPEMQVPDEMRPLLDYLTAMARGRRPHSGGNGGRNNGGSSA